MININGYDVIVVGAGLTGSILARKAAEYNKKVLVIDRREHIAGNLYDFRQNGILIQKYGPHSFHTNSDDVYDFICSFCQPEDFILFCKVFMHGKYTPSPFNFQTIDDYYPPEQASEIKTALVNEYPDRKAVTIVELLKSENAKIKQYADFLFSSDYSLYTAKQWGISPKDVDVNVLKRVPVLLNYDEMYFYDKYQFVPVGGFTEFIKKIITHENISIKVSVDFMDIAEIKDNEIYIDGKLYRGQIIYTGEIDRLFGYKYGALPYRSLRFEFEYHDKESYQDAPVVAYPEDPHFTRITEYSKIPIQDCTGTVIAKEYPQVYDPMKNEPYYPINNECSNEVYEKYKKLAIKINNLILCGRLADFKYYNMDQTIEQALAISKMIK